MRTERREVTRWYEAQGDGAQPPTPSGQTEHRDFLLQRTVWQEEKSDHAMKPGKHYLSQVVKFNVSSDTPCWQYVPWIWCDNGGALPSKAHNPSDHEKTSEKSQHKDTLQTTWPVPLKAVKVIKNKENLKNCHTQKESTKTWPPDAMRHPRWDPGTSKDIRLKTKEIWTKDWLNNNVSVLTDSLWQRSDANNRGNQMRLIRTLSPLQFFYKPKIILKKI